MSASAAAAGVAALEAALNRMTLIADDRAAACAEIEKLIESTAVVRALNSRVTQVAVACLAESSDACASPSESEALLPLVKACCTVLSAASPTVLPPDTISVAVELLCCENLMTHPGCAFQVLDLIATLTADNAEHRMWVGEHGGFPALMNVARAHKKDLTVLFGVAFTVATLTMVDIVNGGLAIEANALQVLVESYKCAVRSRSLDVDLKKDVMKHSREGILNLTKVPFDAAEKAFESVKWGRFGDLIEVDELMFDVEKERKRRVELVAALRRAKEQKSSA